MILYNYAIKFFKIHGVEEYHLRVSKTNVRAIRFYENIGMQKVQEELSGKVIRYCGKV